MTLTDVLLHEAELTYGLTEKLFRRVVDSELSWRPATGKNWMTVGQLLMHCARFGCGRAVQGFVRGDWGLPEGSRLEDLSAEQHVPPVAAPPSVEQALGLLAKDRDTALSCIAEAKEADLLTKIFVAPWGGREVSLFQHLLQMIAHLSQHKGQLFYYLKLIGKDVNTRDLWGRRRNHKAVGPPPREHPEARRIRTSQTVDSIAPSRSLLNRLSPSRRKEDSMVSLVSKIWGDERGQDIAEYAVMLAVILVIVVGTLRLIGSNANNAFSSVASSLQ